ERRSVMVRSVEILLRELARARNNPFIQPSLFHPPGIEAKRVLASHATWTSQQAEISSQIAARLPDGGRMEVQSGLIRQCTKIDVDRAPDAVEACQTLLLHALHVPKSVGDVLKIEPNTSFHQSCPLAAPLAKQVPLLPRRGFMAVGSAERVLMLGLGLQRSRKDQNQEASRKEETHLQHAETPGVAQFHSSSAYRLPERPAIRIRESLNADTP